MSYENHLSQTALLLLSHARTKPDGLTAWLLTGRVGITLRDAANAFRELSTLELMEEKENRLYLTSKGRNWIYQNQEHFAFSGRKSWREVPERFKETKWPMWSPYAPKVSKLDKANFRIALPKKTY